MKQVWNRLPIAWAWSVEVNLYNWSRANLLYALASHCITIWPRSLQLSIAQSSLVVYGQLEELKM